MKFTDGFWLTRPGVTLYNAAQVVDVRKGENEVTVYVAHIKVAHRGMTLNAPLLTLRLRAPRPDILALRVTHHAGVARKEPCFELHEAACPLLVDESEEILTVTAGVLSAVIAKQSFALDFFYEGKRLTGLRDRHMGCAVTPAGTFIRAKLDVSVGEKLYGLGERFTPFIKNGQNVDIWNEDGGTSSEQAYKNIPFYLSNRGYGVFVNSSDRVSYELCSEAVSSAQFSVPGESMEFMVIGGGDPKRALANYVALTGLPALPPAWSFGLWLTTSFTTAYDEETIHAFVDGMRDRGIPLHVFHFDCFWMKGYEWCSFLWDREMFPDPEGLIARLHARGLKVCVWINPYIAQKSPLFEEGMRSGYLLKRSNGDVWQWDMWQAGMGIVDFTNPDACAWYLSKLRILMHMGVDSFKTDFGERIPTDCVYFDGSDPTLMHNYYTLLYNRAVFDLLREERGEGEACVFARSATVGGQQYPVHWGGDSTSNFPSMAESLRGGLSLCLSGFAFWSHDMGGFEDTSTPDVYKRWTAFGLLSTHSRLHGSSSYRVPWLFDEESVDVLRFFTRLKCRLMPYLLSISALAHETGVPAMRAMLLEFADDPGAEDLDRQYMLGDSLLVAPIFNPEGLAEYYLPAGHWTHLLSGQVVGGGWHRELYGYMSLPLFVREHSILPMGAVDDRPDYDYLDGLTLHAYRLAEGRPAALTVRRSDGTPGLTVEMLRENGRLLVRLQGAHKNLSIALHGGDCYTKAHGATLETQSGETIVRVENGMQEIVLKE